MPLIVLLQDVFQKFTRAVKSLEHWSELVDLEVLLVARARSAFLVHWFGSLIPLDGSSVRIAIVNLEALRQRYSLVMSRRRSGLSEGPSVLEPAAGIVGSLAGAALSPLNFLPILAAADPYITDKLGTTAKRVLFKIGVAINSLTWGALGPIVFVLLAAAGPALIVGFAAVPGTREVQDFLTAATRLARPLAEFWRQVSGAREKVKNPIVRAALGVLDKLAVMFPFFMATVAFLIGKVGPLLDPLFHQFQALAAYASDVFHFAKSTGEALLDLFRQWLDPKRKGSLPCYLHLAGEAFGKLLDFLSDAISVRLFGDTKEYFLRIGYGLMGYFDKVKQWTVKRFGQVLDENPVIRLFKAAQAQIDTLTPLFAHLKSPPPHPGSDPGKFTEALKFQFKDAADDIAWMKANLPTFVSDTDIDALLSLHRLSPFPTIAPIVSPPTDPFSEVRTKFASRPRSVFRAERKALDATAIEQFALPNVAMAVTQAHIDETRLREALLAVAARVLPPAMQPYLRTLSDAMEKAERGLGQKAVEPAARTFPVLELPEEERLRPVVGRLVVRVRGAARELSEEWTEGLKATLRAQVYPMPAEGGAA
jgi:hypothetical protein